MKHLIKLPFITLVLIVLMTAQLFSCQKEALSTEEAVPEGKQKVSVYLNDDPDFNFTKVLVDIRYVEVKVDTGRRGHHHDDDDDDDDDHHGHDNYGQWDTLNINPGVYDLLRLRNGVDTLLGTGFVWNGRISKVRLTLGNNNSVWTDSTHSQPLGFCNGRPYVYVKINSNTIDTIPGGGIVLHLDFDVKKSINRRNGNYCLRPHIRSYSHHHNGEIEGEVRPRAANAQIMVYNASDTLYAIPDYDDDDEEGEFKIRGVRPGTYSVLYDAVAPYRDTTLHNIIVEADEDTELPDIWLRQ